VLFFTPTIVIRHIITCIHSFMAVAPPPHVFAPRRRRTALPSAAALSLHENTILLVVCSCPTKQF
jgi:hypothetical protein